jgi:hypothetical protein
MLRAAVVRSRMANDAANGDISAWDDIPDVRDVNPNWGKKGEDDVHPKWRSKLYSHFSFKAHLILRSSTMSQLPAGVVPLWGQVPIHTPSWLVPGHFARVLSHLATAPGSPGSVF